MCLEAYSLESCGLCSNPCPAYKCVFCDQLLNITGIFVSSVLNESQEFISWDLNELICRKVLRKRLVWGWIDGLAVKGMYYSCRGSKFNPYIGELITNSNPSSKGSFGLCWHLHIYSHRHGNRERERKSEEGGEGEGKGEEEEDKDEEDEEDKEEEDE